MVSMDVVVVDEQSSAPERSVTKAFDLHSTLVAIQCDIPGRVKTALASLLAHLDDQHVLQAYIRGSPTMSELLSLSTRSALPPHVHSLGLQCLTAILQSSSRSDASISTRVGAMANAAANGSACTVMSSHLSSDDASLRNAALRFCIALLRNSNGTNALQRLNWSLRLWRNASSTVLLSELFVGALRCSARLALGDGAVLAKTVIGNCARIASVSILDEMLDLLAGNLHLCAALLTTTVLSALTRLHAVKSEPNDLVRNALERFFAKIIAAAESGANSSKTGVLIAQRLCLCMDVWTNLAQRRLVLSWLKQSSDIVPGYVSAVQCSLTPRLSFRWLSNMTFIDELLAVTLTIEAATTLPTPLTRAALSAAIQHTSPLVRHLAYRLTHRLLQCKVANAAISAVLPDGQVVLRSQPADHAPINTHLFVKCVAGYVRLGLLPGHTPWSISPPPPTSSTRPSNTDLVDYQYVALLCASPQPNAIKPSWSAYLADRLATTRSPLVHSRIMALYRFHRLPLTNSTEDYLLEISAKASSIQIRFAASRCNDDERETMIDRLLATDHSHIAAQLCDSASAAARIISALDVNARSDHVFIDRHLRLRYGHALANQSSDVIEKYDDDDNELSKWKLDELLLFGALAFLERSLRSQWKSLWISACNSLLPGMFFHQRMQPSKLHR